MPGASRAYARRLHRKLLLFTLGLLAFLLLTAVSFSLFGFIIGLWADDFQKLQVVPLMIVTPLTFLGGAF